MKKRLFSLVCKVDKSTSRFFNRIKNKLNPLGVINSFHPMESEYVSYAGTDIKVQILDPNQPVRTGNNPQGSLNGVFGNVQGLSFGRRNQEEIGGTFSGIIYDSMRPFHLLLGQEKRLVLSGANEVGKVCTLYDGIIKFDDYLQWGVSVDDIVVEVRIDFTQLSQKLDLEE